MLDICLIKKKILSLHAKIMVVYGDESLYATIICNV